MRIRRFCPDGGRGGSAFTSETAGAGGWAIGSNDALGVLRTLVRGELRGCVRDGGRHANVAQDGAGVLEASARDFILRRSDLSNFDITPRPKDTITDGTEVWTVFNQLDNECWRAVGDTGLIRVHCRK